MEFDGWPQLAEGCPICSGLQCAIFKGYYQRKLYCPDLEYLGPVVIRTGLCKSRRIRFSLLPDFLIRFKRISIFSFRLLHECYHEQQSIVDPIV